MTSGSREAWPAATSSAEVAELDAALPDAELLLAIQALTVGGDLGRRVGIHDLERVTRLRHAAGTQHLHGCGRTGGLHGVAALVQHRPDATVVESADERVADPQRALLDEHGDDGALPDVELGLDDRALGRPIGVRLQLEHLGLEEHLLEQILDPLTGLGGNLGRRAPRRRSPPRCTLCCSSCCLTRPGSAAGRSTLLIATIIGTPAFLAWLIASIVCGMTESSAATIRMTMSVTSAPRARIAVKAA